MNFRSALGPLVVLAALPARAYAAEPDPACMSRAKTRADIEACIEEATPKEVTVRAKPPPRSASDQEIDAKTVTSAPHETAADTLNVVPGVFVSDRGLPGRAPHLSLRGFDGTSGQDVAIFAGNIPLNQVSHVRAPGYADMRLVPPEVIRSLRVSHGPYDPRQGDFAVAGSVHMGLGLESPGFWTKGSYGSFGSKRVLLAFAPESREMNETFAAFVTDSTDGPGGVRSGERSSFIGQFGGGEEKVQFHTTLAIGSARFDFPGYLSQSAVERGAYPYGATLPLGRDRTSQTLAGADVVFSVEDGTLGMGVFVGRTKTSFHQDLTGFLLDAQAGVTPTVPDDAEQVNRDEMLGLSMLYRHGVKLTSRRDSVEMGVYARVDDVSQTDTRLAEDGTKHSTSIDADIDVTNVAAYADASLYPWRRVVVRGGTRLDSLSYGVADHTGNAGLERTAQGFHLGNKATADVAAGGGVHVVASYGEGFRSPQARELQEGERVPFATVRSVEAGVRAKEGKRVEGSLVGFSSWLSHDRVFDASQRTNAQAPSSIRAGAAATGTAREGIFGSTTSLTYARARFTGSGAGFSEGDPVPYAPSFVMREDAFVAGRLGRLDGRRVSGRVGVGLEGVAGRELPLGRDGKDIVYVDALAAVTWRELELGVNGTNLFGLRYYDSQYVYASNFEKSPTVPAPTPHVLVAPPTMVFVTLTIHLRGILSDQGDRREHECLRRAKTDAQRENCVERTDTTDR